MKNKYLKLSYISLALVAVLAIGSCSGDTTLPTDVYEEERVSTVLVPCDDLGQEYIDSFIFFGESTTYHLKSRGVLRGGTETTQVWSPKNGTANLDTTISEIKIVYPETGEEMTVYDAAKQKKPQRIILTFGLNGAVTKLKKGEDYFKTCYKSLINDILSASPDTTIIIQSCFPIAENMDMSAYSVDAKTLNEYIDTINGWSLSLAEELGLGYLDTQEVLRGNDGYLRQEYQAGDGYHLTAEAYRIILKYIRTHTYGG